MAERVFREKSIKKVQSPEDLNEYIRVANPGVWLLLVAVIVLLAGACIWATFGRIETTVKTYAAVEDGKVTCFTDNENVKAGMTLKIYDINCTVTDVKLNAETGKIVCFAKPEKPVADGQYEAEIILDSVKPISFVLNSEVS